MPEETGLVAASLVGLLGSTHCIGMCGGIVGACVLSLPQQVRRSAPHLVAYLGAYNAGRLSSYTLAGGAIGFLGGQVTGLVAVVGWLLMVALAIWDGHLRFDPTDAAYNGLKAEAFRTPKSVQYA